MIEVVDTNVLVRLLVGDVKKQQKEAMDVFRDAELGLRKILIKPTVVAETCFVLESYYKKRRQQIVEKLSVLLNQKWIKVDERREMQSSWQWYLKGLHFVDSYLLAWSKLNKGKVLSFDKKLSKLGG